MSDPYRRYTVPDVRGSVPSTGFPAYLPLDTPILSFQKLKSTNDLRGTSTDYLQRDVLPVHPGAYGVDGGINIGVRGDSSSVSGLIAGTTIKGYPSLEDPSLISQRRDPALGIAPGIPDMMSKWPSSSVNVDVLPVATGESNILFVDGLPTDSTRREVGHLFRPFIGFKDIKLVHKEPRFNGDKAMVLCFVEFDDAKCALTALEALQGYKFDNKKTESPDLRLYFAHFPFRLPSDRSDQRTVGQQR